MTDQHRGDDPRHQHNYQKFTTPKGVKLLVCNGLNCESKLPDKGDEIETTLWTPGTERDVPEV